MISRTLLSLLILSGTCAALISCTSTRSGDTQKTPADSAAPAAAAGASCSVVGDPIAPSTPASGPTLLPGGAPVFGAVALPSFSRSMGQISDMYGHLAEVEKAGWIATKDYPMPAADAGKMADLFHTLATGEKAKTKPAEFATIMSNAGNTAASLQTMLAGGTTAAGGVDTKKASAQFASIGASCAECHTKYGN